MDFFDLYIAMLTPGERSQFEELVERRVAVLEDVHDTAIVSELHFISVVDAWLHPKPSNLELRQNGVRLGILEGE